MAFGHITNSHTNRQEAGSHREAAMIGKMLSQLRKSSGKTQNQLATLLQVDQSTISHVERESRETTSSLIEQWISVCGGSLEIRPAGSSISPALAQLVEAAQSLSEEDLARLAKMARGIPLVNKMMKDAIAEDWGSRGERADAEAARKRA